MTEDLKRLKGKILSDVEKYSKLAHSQYYPVDHAYHSKWQKGDPMAYAGRVFDEREVKAAVETVLDFWLTLGEKGALLEKRLADFLGVHKSILVNSGSSANLLALSALTSYKLPKNKRILKGDEVITVAAGFPTTAAPISQIGATPVFIDADSCTGNPVVEQLEKAYNPKKTKAVIFAHALGNPFDIYTTLSFCRKYDLWLIEDNCDALGSSYSIPASLAMKIGVRSSSKNIQNKNSDLVHRWTGSWGDISTQSFYPPHHITMGEGGAVNVVSNPLLAKLVESFRDWGRDCWCPSGVDNTCKKRYEWSLGELPKGYDHKYTYSHLGYNLKPLDIQASIGLEQLEKLPSFIEQRKKNWSFLRKSLDHLSNYFDFTLPTHSTQWVDGNFEWDDTECVSHCSWFGFKILLKDNSNINREEFLDYLNSKGIGTRLLFGGNLVKQPAYVALKKDSEKNMRVISELSGSDSIMKNVFFLGTYPGLSKEMLQYQVDVINSYIMSIKDV